MHSQMRWSMDTTGISPETTSESSHLSDGAINISSGNSGSNDFPSRSPDLLSLGGAEERLMPARLVFIGAHRVGSSSLIRRFSLGLYKDEYTSEICKVMRHTKSIRHPRYGHYVTVQFWDVEGLDTRLALQCAYKAHAIAVVYDITNRTSFEKAQKLLDGVNPRASSVLIGNKVDLHDYRKVSFEEGRLLARIHRLDYIETSARLNYNVDEAFHILIASVPDEYLHNINSSAARHWRLAADLLCAACRRKIERHAACPRSRHQSSPSDSGDADDLYRRAPGSLQRHRSYESLREVEHSPRRGRNNRVSMCI